MAQQHTALLLGKEDSYLNRSARKLKAWHRRSVTSNVDRQRILYKAYDEAALNGRYCFMILMSAAIAILGMLLQSPVVVIGAMLISPLMAPIVGLGFGLATFDWAQVRKSLLTLAAGTILAILFTALVVLLSPLKDMTTEISARTRPNLFDLLVAVFSALAGGYAHIRGRGDTIVGVALATSLMPPLAAVGYGVATLNPLVAAGAFALFLTNFIAIGICLALMARFYGFGSFLHPKQSKAQATALVLLLILMSIPLALSLRQIAWEAWATRTVRSAVTNEFGSNSRIVALDPDFSGGKFLVRATVLTDRIHNKAVEDIQLRVGNQLGRPLQMQLSQVLVDQGNARAELERARSNENAAQADRVARADMAARLALVSGLSVDEVIVDPVTRMATAQILDSRSLYDLMQAERRLQQDSPGWTIQLLPQPSSLPLIALSEVEGELIASENDLDTVAWYLQRRGTDSATVSARQAVGEPAARATKRASIIAAALESRGIIASVSPPKAADRSAERELGTDWAKKIMIEPLPKSQPELKEAEEQAAEKTKEA